MNLVEPLAQRLFRWNHDQVMRAGGVGLAAHLGVPLVSSADGMKNASQSDWGAPIFRHADANPNGGPLAER
jgi:hypothetical protein